MALIKQKRIVIIAPICAVILGLISWYVYSNFIFTRPLGDKLEYVGKDDYGCILVCDSNPASDYYYATDMTPNQIASYFKKASIKSSEDTTLQEDPSIPITFPLILPNGDKFYVTYYTNGQKELQNIGIQKNIGSKHAISILNSQYESAKHAL